jgi:endonuclease YncB( thermonuclease family)/uncharacterized protein YdeI (BOF family)
MKKYILFLLMLVLIVSSFLPMTSHANSNTYEDLIISEYIEGSSYNKAIELYNGTDDVIDLSQYTLVRFVNGADQSNGSVHVQSLSGTLSSGDVYVIAHQNADAKLLNIASALDTSYGFNGDDAIVLFKDYITSTRSGTVIDSFGKVGEDPGSYWGSSSVKTQNKTLIRNKDVLVGDTNIYDSFDPAVQWISFNEDTFDYIGSYPDEIVIEEPKDEYISSVERVVDGDTIVLSTPVLGVKKVRYLNIDTPETYHMTGDYDPNLINIDPDHSQKYHGELAKDYLNSILKQGDEVIVKVGEEAVDQYGRLLAQIIRKSDGLNTNLEMVKAGHAVTYFIYPTGDEETYLQFQAAVKEAKGKKLGIWNETSPVMELPFEFRARDMNKGYTKYVGNSDTQEYVQPDNYETVPVENRVFFVEEMEAIMAGYKPGFDREPIIADARYAKKYSDIVTVKGIVTASFYAGGETNFFISDYSGGIIVRTGDLNANIGDTISATGTTGEYIGMLQVYPSKVEIIATGGTPEPYAISASEIGEKVEGQFVSLEEVKIISVNKYNEYTAVDTSGSFFTIDTEEVLEIGTNYDHIIGVINYAHSKYKVVTRSSEDIIKNIPLISIEEARNADLDTKVHVEGIVTAAFYAGGKTNYFIQDETGAIVVRIKGFNADVGDKIRAKARTEEYWGMLQIVPSIENVKIVEASVGTPEPKLITSSNLGEDLEGQLVAINYVSVNDVKKYKYNYDYFANDSSGEFTLDSDDQYFNVGTIYETIVGVVDYNYSKYKIRPRSLDDVVVLSFFANYTSGEESLETVTESIINASQYLTTNVMENLLIEQLTASLNYKNAEQHIPVTVQHIMTSLEKLSKGHHKIEVEKIEHELEKIFKKQIKQK